VAVQDSLIYRQEDDHEGRRLLCRHARQIAAALRQQAVQQWS
jgi:hypothetical protein